MNRREFLTTAAALGAASQVAPTARPATASPAHETAAGPPRGHAPRAQSGTWRLEYPPTRAEAGSGLVARNLSFPPGDPRRY